MDDGSELGVCRFSLVGAWRRGVGMEQKDGTHRSIHVTLVEQRMHGEWMHSAVTQVLGMYNNTAALEYNNDNNNDDDDDDVSQARTKGTPTAPST